MDRKGGEGVLQPPSLTSSCSLYRCPLRMTSFNAQPSLFQRVSVTLLPLTFLIPPCLSLFSPPSSLPSLSLVSPGRQVKLLSCVALICLKTPPSLRPGQMIRCMLAGMSQPTTKGAGYKCVHWKSEANHGAWGVGVLKIVTILRQHCVCVCVSIWLLEKDSVVRETAPLKTMGGCWYDTQSMHLPNFFIMGIFSPNSKNLIICQSTVDLCQLAVILRCWDFSLKAPALSEAV